MSSLYVYRAELVEVIDGDTFDLKVDVGFHSTFASRFRLYGWDTPELRRGSDAEKAAAQVAKAAAEQWFGTLTGDLLVRTYKADSFGRWLASCFDSEHPLTDLGRFLHARELASRWPTRWRDAYDNS